MKAIQLNKILVALCMKYLWGYLKPAYQDLYACTCWTTPHVRIPGWDSVVMRHHDKKGKTPGIPAENRLWMKKFTRHSHQEGGVLCELFLDLRVPSRETGIGHINYVVR